MSNVIKSYSVRYEEAVKKTIDVNAKKDQEILQKRNLRLTTTVSKEETGEFVEGIKAVVVDALPTEEEQKENNEKQASILENAKQEAQEIIENAKQEARRMKEEAIAQGKQIGYEEGIKQANIEIQNKNAALDDKAKQLQEEFDEMVRRLEPHMVEIMAALIEKITGILVQDRQEVILYLVEKAFLNAEKTNEYTIRVGSEDYEYLNDRKDFLISAIGRDVQVNIVEDTALHKNQCLIETQLRVIDCSLDVQLRNLITDLKLLGSV